jgi:acyl transferase domain-containing protein/SAM-dependent methyltransferase
MVRFPLMIIFENLLIPVILAGIPIHTIAGSEMSCYVGGFTRGMRYSVKNEHNSNHLKEYERVSSTELSDTLLYSVTGNGLAMLSNRLSWFYDLRGESVTFDTACSSSLVALHHACASIRASKSSSRQAIVAGSNLVLLPDPMVSMNPLHMLSPDSQCFTFDKRANGFVRGEGVGVLILKHIDDAIRDNDCIRAVIRGTGVNQDGRTPGITLPSADAQARLIQTTYDSFNLSTSETSYFEAHGTGTPAGDAIEVAAIASVFNRSNSESPLFVGSAKPNIGHLEGAAGIAGLIKSILAVERSIIPPNINFEQPNPKLRMDERNLRVATVSTPWPHPGLRRASINSFGYGGTNAHCVIDDAFNYLKGRGISGRMPKLAVASMVSSRRISEDSAIGLGGYDQKIERMIVSHKATLVTLSTPDQAALLRLVKIHSDYLKSCTSSESVLLPEFLDNLAYTYNCRRSVLQWRTCVVTHDTADLANRLSSIKAPVRKTVSPGLIFCFTGQGAQWYGMGRELMIYDVYRTSVETAAAYLSSSLGCPWNVMTELFADEDKSNINMAQYSQPLCTILQVALVELLQHWGIAPKVVVGHSSGEIASAYASGAISAEDAWKIGFHRGRLCGMIKDLAPHLQGTMLAVGLSPEDIEPYVKNLDVKDDETLTIACFNSPSNITMSGDAHLIYQLETELQDKGIFCRLLRVENAYHSSHIKTISELFRSSIAGIKPRKMTPGLVMFSSVTAGTVKGEDLGVEYWIGNTLAPANFTQALEAALLAAKSTPKKQTGVPPVNTIIEIGPHSALQGPIRQILAKVNKADSVSYVSALVRNKSAVDTLLNAVGTLWCRGFNVTLDRVNSLSSTPEIRTPLVDLPKYPWNHDNRYWHESTSFQSHRFRAAPRTDLLGAPELEFDWNYPAWKNFIRLSEQPWIMDHRVHGSIIFPASGMLCAALEGVKALVDNSKIVKHYELRDVNIGRALVIPQSDPGIEVWTRLKPLRKFSKADVCHHYQFTFTSLEEASFQNRVYVEHASGTVAVIFKEYPVVDGIEEQRKAVTTHELYRQASRDCTNTINGDEHYQKARKMGLEYGPAFNGLKLAHSRAGEATFLLEIQDTKQSMPSNFEYPFLIHPTTLDVVLHSSIQAFGNSENNSSNGLVPVSFKSVTISANLPNAAHTELIGFANATRTGFNHASAHISVSTEGWPETLIQVQNMTLKSLGNSAIGATAGEPNETVRKVAARQIWKPAIDLIDPRRKDLCEFLCNNVASVKDLTACATAGTRIAAAYIKRALNLISPEIEAQIPERFIGILEWMKSRHALALACKLPYQSEAESCWLCTSFEEEEKFIDTFKEEYPADGEALQMIGSNLFPILCGTVEPQQLMHQNGMLSNFHTSGYILKSGHAMLKSWFDLQGHKQPDMKILEIGAGTGSVTLQILSTLSEEGGTSLPRFTSFCFTDKDIKSLEKAKLIFRDWDEFISYQTLDIEKDALDQGFLLNSFDVIFCGSGLFAPRIDIVLSNCLKLLKPGGTLAFHEMTWKPDHISLISRVVPEWRPTHDDSILSPGSWKIELQCRGFDVQEPIIVQDASGNPHTTMLIAHKSTYRPKNALTDVSIVKPITQCEAGDLLVQKLSKYYKDRGALVHVWDFDQALLLAGTISTWGSNHGVVSLLEAFDPVVVRSSRDEFEAIQSLVLASKMLLWVSCRVSATGVREPDACIIPGILRTARSEDVGLYPQELHIKGRDISQMQEVAEIISRVTNHTWDTDAYEDFENEIVEIAGLLHVPRIVDDMPMNRILHSLGCVPEPELQFLSQTCRPMKLTIGTPGMLDTLHYIDDPTSELELLQDEVEIEVKANGLDIL